MNNGCSAAAILFIPNRLWETTTTTWHQQVRSGPGYMYLASSILWSIVNLVAFNLLPILEFRARTLSQWEFLSDLPFVVLLLDVMRLPSIPPFSQSETGMYLLVDVPSTDQNTTVIATGYVLFCCGGVESGSSSILINIIIRI